MTLTVEKKRRYTLGKNERLKKRKAIEELFASGESFAVHPFRVYFLKKKIEDCIAINGRLLPAESVLQAGVGVSKRNFKKAVDRNKIKRITREAYRLQRTELEELIIAKKEWCLKLFFIYNGTEKPDYRLVREKVRSALSRLHEKFK